MNEILRDRTSSGHDRLTCVICGKTLVHEPFMGGLRWINEESVFRKTHWKCKMRAADEAEAVK